MRKHSEEAQKIKQLENTIVLKEKEIKDVKNSIANILQSIRNINESNDYGDLSVKKRKISELCTDTIYELFIDDIDEKYQKNTKIIELQTYPRK